MSNTQIFPEPMDIDMPETNPAVMGIDAMDIDPPFPAIDDRWSDTCSVGTRLADIRVGESAGSWNNHSTTSDTNAMVGQVIRQLAPLANNQTLLKIKCAVVEVEYPTGATQTGRTR